MELPATRSHARLAPASQDLPAHALLRRAVLPPSWLVVAALTVLSLSGISLPEPVLFAPFALSLVFLGLPHGAVDHLVLLRLRRAPLRTRPLLGVLLPYLGLAGLYLALWFLAPLAAFLFFILMTWFHWGQGDLHGLLFLSRARHLPGRGVRTLAVAVRGGLPMLVPLLAFPEVYRDVAELVTGVIRPDALTQAAWLFDAPFRTAAGVAFLTAALLYAGMGYRHADPDGRGPWREDVFELGLLAVFFAAVHPILAVGAYFCLWHAPRHIARLAAYDAPSAAALRADRLRPALARFARRAWPTTVAALGLLGLLYLLVPVSPAALPELTGLYLVLIAVLTLPHVWVVGKMDRAEGVWRSAGRLRP